MRVAREEADVAAEAAASAITALPTTAMTGTGINSAKGTGAITGAITMAAYTILRHTITTMITTKPPVTNTVEIAFMIITTIDVIATKIHLKKASKCSSLKKLVHSVNNVP